VGPTVRLEVNVARRPVHTIRGLQRNHALSGLTTPKIQGPSFPVTGWTVTHGRVWFSWHRSSQAISTSSVWQWGAVTAFGLFETGTTILGPDSSPNAPQWVHWQPLTPRDNGESAIWYDATTGSPANREWSLVAGYAEWETQRTAPGNGMDLWWCTDFYLSIGGSDTLSWAWVIQYYSL